MNISIISDFFFALAFLGVIWFVVTSILIYNALRNRNINVSFLWLQFMILKYASQYKEITLRETGKVGPLFYHWIISINTALIAAIVGYLLTVV